MHVTLDQQTLKLADQYIYLGHPIKLDKNSQTVEVKRRVGQSRAAFGILRYVLGDCKIPINHKQ